MCKQASWFKRSEYISLKDATKLACYIYTSAETNATPKPVLWMYDRYHSARDKENPKKSITSTLTQWLESILSAGYIVVIVDARGTGASLGHRHGPFSKIEQADTIEIMDWLTTQSWCNGNLGMFGRSYRGISQYFAAAQQHPNLKATLPEMALFDLYSFAYSNGVFRHDFAENWSKKVASIDVDINNHQIDTDSNGSLLQKALKEHEKNTNAHDFFFSLPYRDSKANNQLIYQTRSPHSYIHAINKSNVPFLHLAGWYDIWVKDALLWFNNLTVPQKLIIGPWAHDGIMDDNLAKYHISWFDFWLKETKNINSTEVYGYIDYYTIGKQLDVAWNRTKIWPPKNSFLKKFSLIISNTKKNIQLLTNKHHKEIAQISSISQKIDTDFTSGKATRWRNAYGGKFSYQNFAKFDSKTLVFETEPLQKKIEITGHPILSLWINAEMYFIDIFAFLEDLDETGYSQYVTEGNLRSTHRKLSKPEYKSYDLPYHSGLSNDLLPLTSDPSYLKFDLQPISYVFHAGHKIRVRITACDKDNAMSPYPPLDKLEYTFFSSIEYPSSIQLPIIEIDKDCTNDSI